MVLGILVLILLGATFVFEVAGVVAATHSTQRAAQSGALAGLYTYKRTQLKYIEEVRALIGNTVPIPLLKQEEIKTKSSEEAETAARDTAGKIAGARSSVAAHFHDKTMRVQVDNPYKPLFFKIVASKIQRTVVMSYTP
jgi:hypothetical protein